MGSGKTTIAKKIANKLSYKFVDIDKLIEDKYRKTIFEIFRDKDEKYFRNIEKETLESLITDDNIVIATGGGCPCFNNNMSLMNKTGITIYLKLKTGFLINRLINSKVKRPLIEGKSKEELKDFIEKTLSEREIYYNQAKIIIDAENFKISELIEKL